MKTSKPDETRGADGTSQPTPKVKLSAAQQDAMMALEARIAAEDAEDARRERRRIRAGLPEPRREIKTFAGWADGGVSPREPLG